MSNTELYQEEEEDAGLQEVPADRERWAELVNFFRDHSFLQKVENYGYLYLIFGRKFSQNEKESLELEKTVDRICCQG